MFVIMRFLLLKGFGDKTLIPNFGFGVSRPDLGVNHDWKDGGCRGTSQRPRLWMKFRPQKRNGHMVGVLMPMVACLVNGVPSNPLVHL